MWPRLFRTLAGLTVTEEDLDHFRRWQRMSVVVGVLPKVSQLTRRRAITDALAWRTSMLERMCASLSNLPGPNSEEEVDILARAVMDSITFAGGLSVPMWINAGAAVWWSTSEYGVNVDLPDLELTPFLFEVARTFPLVNSVPFQRDGRAYQVSLRRALSDPLVWDEPNQFRIRPLEHYERSFLGFAEPAEGTGGRSRSCPGRSLAFAMARAWMRVVRPSGWTLAQPVQDKIRPPYFDDVMLRAG